MNQFNDQSIELLNLHIKQIDIELKQLDKKVTHLFYVCNRLALDLTLYTGYEAQATVISAILKFLKLEHTNAESLITEYIKEITEEKVKKNSATIEMDTFDKDMNN